MDLKTLFFGHHEQKRVQVPRAVISSTISAVFDYMTMILLVEFFAVDPLSAGTIGMLVGLVLVYLAGRFWIYPPVPGYAVGAEAVLFLVIAFIGAGIHTAVLSQGLKYLPVHYLVVRAAASALMFCWNFSMRRLVNNRIRRLHRKKKDPAHESVQ